MYTLQELVRRRVLVLDGAMGTMIQRYGLSEADFRAALDAFARRSRRYGGI